MFVVYTNFRCLGASNKINRLVRLGLLLALSLLLPTAVQSAVTTYTDEAAYLADLSAYTRVSESFEGSAWDAVRSSVLDPQVLPGITNLGLTWQNRFFPVGGVTTSDGGGDVHEGSWLFYAAPHGAYGSAGLDCTVPGACGDGFTVTSEGAGTMVGVGGWFTGASGPEIRFILDDKLVPDAGGTGTNSWQFFGVIDTNGFTRLEIMDSSGTLDDQNLIWADDFTFGVTDAPPPAGSLQFSAAAFSVAESDASVAITVTRTGGSAGAVSVNYASSDGSATAGGDYTATVGTLSFADGMTSQSFSVAILDDTFYEGDEGFNLSLSNVAGGASLGIPATASVTITEDDPPPPAGSLQFSAAGFSVAESGASVAISVTRTGGSAGAVSVDYASSDGSATAGSDYTATAGALSFADSVTSQSFSVPILDDVSFEGDETFSLNLSNVIGGASLGLPAAASVTITEDDPPPLLDSNGDGLSDADAIALGLDPNDPDEDTDNDGISDVLEVGVDVNNPLDGDVDGVIDALEPGTDAADAMIASGLSLDGGGTLVITTAVGETLSRVSTAAATGGPIGINFPFGTVSYTTSSAVGGSVTVQMEFSVDLPANLALYKLDHAGIYTELTTGLWTRVSPRRVDLTLTDGDPLTDLDGIANASIEDPVAPAEVVPLVDSSGGGGGGGGCVLNSATHKDPTFPLFLLAALLYRFRRRSV